MNKLATALLISAIATILIGCSSGGSSTPEPQSVNGTFTGTWSNTPDTQDGTATFNLSQATDSNIVNGNAIFDSTGTNTCLISATVSDGSVQGFAVTLAIGDSSFQLTISNGGNTLSGTYVRTADSDTCSGQTGSGTITLNRS